MDIQTSWNAQTGFGDWLLDPTTISLWVDETGASIVDQNGMPIDSEIDLGMGLVQGGDLFTAVLISLFSDAAADDDDVIPDGSTNRRGWWGGPIGSKLWLLSRAKQTAEVLLQAQGYISQALAWLVSDGVASTVNVSTSYPLPGQLSAKISINRGDGKPLTIGFANLWADL